MADNFESINPNPYYGRSLEAQHIESKQIQHLPPLELTPGILSGIGMENRDIYHTWVEPAFKAMRVLNPFALTDTELLERTNTTVIQDYFDEYLTGIKDSRINNAEFYREFEKNREIVSRQGNIFEKWVPPLVGGMEKFAPFMLMAPEASSYGLISGAASRIGFNTSNILVRAGTRTAANAIDVGALSVAGKWAITEVGLLPEGEEPNYGEEFATGAAFGAGLTAAGAAIKPLITKPAKMVAEKLNHWFYDSKNTAPFKHAAETFDQMIDNEAPKIKVKDFDDLGNALKAQGEEQRLDLGKDSGTLNLKNLRNDFEEAYNKQKQIEFEESKKISQDELDTLKALKEPTPEELKRLEEVTKKFEINVDNRMEAWGDFIEKELHTMWREGAGVFNAEKQANFFSVEGARTHQYINNYPTLKGTLPRDQALGRIEKDLEKFDKVHNGIIHNDFSGFTNEEKQIADSILLGNKRVIEMMRDAGVHIPELGDGINYTYMGWSARKVRKVPEEVFVDDVVNSAFWERMIKREEDSLKWTEKHGTAEELAEQRARLTNIKDKEGQKEIIRNMREGIITGMDDYIPHFFSRKRQVRTKTHSKFFFPKDGKLYRMMLEKYGHGYDAVSSIEIGMKGMERSIATARVFGPKGWEVLGNYLKTLEPTDNMFSKQAQMERLYHTMTKPIGDTNMRWAVQGYNNLKSAMISSKLGFVFRYNMIEDFGNAALNTAQTGQGKTFFKNLPKYFQKNLGMSEEQLKKLVRQTLIDRERFVDADFIEGKDYLRGLRDFTMKIQGVHLFNNQHYNFSALTYQNTLGEFLKKNLSWEQLPKKWKEWAVRDGITKKEYDLVRANRDIAVEELNGEPYFYWQNLYENPPNGAVKAAADAFGSAEIAFQERSVVTSSKVTRAKSLIGRPLRIETPGDILHDAAATFTDVPLQLWFNLLEKDPLKRFSISLLPKIIMGYAIKYVEAAARGETLDFEGEKGFAWHTMDAAFKGGAAGLMGDVGWHLLKFIMDLTVGNKDFGHALKKSLEDTLLGAAGSYAVDLASLPYQLLTGQNQKAVENASKLMPLSNNPAVAAAMNKYILPEYYEHYTEDGGWQHYKNEARSRQFRGTKEVFD